MSTSMPDEQRRIEVEVRTKKPACQKVYVLILNKGWKQLYCVLLCSAGTESNILIWMIQPHLDFWCVCILQDYGL